MQPAVARDEEVALATMAEQQEAQVGPDSEPLAPPARKRRRRGEVRVFGHWCKGCGLCIAFCPGQVFVAGEDGHPLAAYPERCTACMWCTEHCPDFAIQVEPLSGSDDIRRGVAWPSS